MIKPIKERASFTCSFNTTEECNLRCKYCYEINKKPRVLSLDNAYSYINHIFTDPDPAGLLEDPDVEKVFKDSYNNGLIFDFIGGDSLMNIDILNSICEYSIKKLWTMNTPNTLNWREKFQFSISTNGTLFEEQNVKDWCLRYKDILQLGVSIDGCPKIHDLNRVYKNGEGSMKTILKSWDWFQKEFPLCSMITKSTCNKDSIPYLYESLKFMYETLGIRYIHQNFIMEDMHLTNEDYKVFDEQMEKCIEYMLQHQNDFYWSLIDEDLTAGSRLSKKEDWEKKGWCGSGAMPALGVDGNIYPCIRWLPHTQCEKGNFIVGTAKDGFTHKENFKKVREGAYKTNCSKEQKCRNCNIESMCAYCIGGCYSEFGEFRRTTYTCELNKHIVKWARIYWNEYNRQNGIDKRYDVEEINDRIGKDC